MAASASGTIPLGEGRRRGDFDGFRLLLGNGAGSLAQMADAAQEALGIGMEGDALVGGGDLRAVAVIEQRKAEGGLQFPGSAVLPGIANGRASAPRR
ncbi:MAG: hypothetical protein QM711_12805 [Micropruina sp.]|uniref:hypothetical protein n=1 Tax=Micropruina sp. TaxID=2737536 RepID=UPI0039E5B217